MEKIEQLVLDMWRKGMPIEKIEEQLKIVVEVADEENLNESMIQGNFVVKQILLG
jgi:hypothetical protein